MTWSPALQTAPPATAPRAGTPEPAAPFIVAVIGGGASGTLLTAELLRRARHPIRIVVVERSGRLGPGLAYGTPSSSHLLNARVGQMSAFDNDPGHLSRWLAERLGAERGSAGDFVPRSVFGEYLIAVATNAAQAAPPGVDLAVHAEEAVRVEATDFGWAVHLRRGFPLAANAVVLATGVPPPADPPTVERALLGSRRWRGDPWAANALEAIPRSAGVLLLGTGLTMVDQALALDDAGHSGPIVALSSHGLLPSAHLESEPPARRLDVGCEPPRTARAWLRWFRDRYREEAGQGDPELAWRRLIDGLREPTPVLWNALPWDERRRLLRFLQPLWDTRRHRMAPQVAARISALRAAGRLTVLAGRPISISSSPAGVDLRWMPRGGRAPRDLRGFWAVVNCTGPSFGTAAVENAVVRRLVEDGLARLDPLGLGLIASPRGELLGSRRGPLAPLYALGPPLHGTLWETTAIPEIRAQARRLAGGLLEVAAQRSLRALLSVL